MHNRKKSSCWVFAGLLVTILLTAVYWHFTGRDFSAFILLSDNNIEQVAFSKAIYEDPFSFARNMLPLQYAALLLLIQQKQGLSSFIIVVSAGTATLFYLASVLNL